MARTSPFQGIDTTTISTTRRQSFLQRFKNKRMSNHSESSEAQEMNQTQEKSDQLPKENEEEEELMDDSNVNTKKNQKKMANLPDLPLDVVLGNVLQFLDRNSWLNVSMLNKDIRKVCLSSSSSVPGWPKSIMTRYIQNEFGSLSFSPNGRSLVFQDAIGRICIFDSLYGRHKPKQLYISSELGQIAFCPTNSSILAIGCCATRSGNNSPFTTTMLWDLSTGNQENDRLPPSTDGSNSKGIIGWSPCGTFLAEIFDDLTIRIYNTVHRAWYKTLSGIGMIPRRWRCFSQMVAFSPNQQYVAAILGGQLYIWDIGFPNKATKIGTNDFGYNSLVSSFSFSPCHKYIAYVIGGSNTVYILSLIKDDSFLKCVGTMREDHLRLFCVAFDPKDKNGTTLVTSGSDDYIRSWQLQEITQEHNNNDADADADAFEHNNFHYLGDVKLSLVGRCIGAKRTKSYGNFISNITFSPDGNSIAFLKKYTALDTSCRIELFNNELTDRPPLNPTETFRMANERRRRRRWRRRLSRLFCWRR